MPVIKRAVSLAHSSLIVRFRPPSRPSSKKSAIHDYIYFYVYILFGVRDKLQEAIAPSGFWPIKVSFDC